MSYCITLVVTSEQESAIIALFKEKCWIYVKTGKRFIYLFLITLKLKVPDSDFNVTTFMGVVKIDVVS